MIHVLDTCHRGRRGIIAVTALETRDGVVLFDVGPESTYQHVVKELADSGLAAHDIRHVFLSHIHFDHAGAAWRFAEAGATVYVHPRGAPHLLDPSRLVASARRIFGDKMDELWGTAAPIPNDKLKVVEDRETVRVGNDSIQALATPGHATHHHVYFWDSSLFGGDVAGVRLGQGPAIPPFVPPELEIEAWQQSIDRMRELEASDLYLPHFGKVEGSTAEHFDQLTERVTRWSEWLRTRIQEGQSEQELVAGFAEYEKQDLLAAGIELKEVDDYEAADPSYMAVTAARRCWQTTSSRRS